MGCGEPIEAQYYNPTTRQKGGHKTTTDICAVCWSEEHVFSPDEIRNIQDVGGKLPLQTCKLCLYLNIEVPCSTGHQSNQQKKKHQQKRRKREQFENAVRKKK